MSAPIRTKAITDQNAEGAGSEQQSQPELALETPCTLLEDPRPAEPPRVNLETGPDNRLASTNQVVVRRLKDPPEIWDLVQETTAHFNPTGAFVARLTHSKRKLAMVVLSAIFISGLSAFVLTTLRDRRMRDKAVGQVTESVDSSSDAEASRPDDAVPSSQDVPVGNSPGAASVLDNTSSQPSTPTQTDSHPQPAIPSTENSAFARPAPNESLPPRGVSDAPPQANGIDNISKRTTSHTGRARSSGNNQVAIATGDHTSEKLADTSSSSRRRVDTGAKTQTSPASKLDQKQGYDKASNGAPPANKGSIPTLSPQLIAPPTTTSAPKGKVIQWP